MKEGGTSNRFRRTQPPRARHEYTVRRSAGRSDVPNEYQQAQPPPLSPLPALLCLLLSLLSFQPYVRGRGRGRRILFPRAWRARGHERLLGFRFSCPPHRQLLFRTRAMTDRSGPGRRRRRREFSRRDAACTTQDEVAPIK